MYTKGRSTVQMSSNSTTVAWDRPARDEESLVGNGARNALRGRSCSSRYLRHQALPVVLPDRRAPLTRRLCIADSERILIPEALWSGREGQFPSCGWFQAFLDFELFVLRRCGDVLRPRRSAPRPTYFPNLWP